MSWLDNEYNRTQVSDGWENPVPDVLRRDANNKAPFMDAGTPWDPNATMNWTVRVRPTPATSPPASPPLWVPPWTAKT